VSTSPASAFRTIAYGDDPSQFGELTLPTGQPKGVVVVIHGGAAWNIEYRRVGNGGGDPATFDDVAAAIDALRDQGLPLDRVLALGHSAGGHLATWAASRGRFRPWRTEVDLTGVVSQAGVLDLTSAYEDDLGDGAVVGLLGRAPGLHHAPLDPRLQIPLDVPVHCIHGRDDDIVPIGQSADYVAAARAAGAEADLTEVEGDHFVVIDPSSSVWTRTLEILDGL
jgi:pimeloyl-ACP methyl ester carboxylesterase